MSAASELFHDGRGLPTLPPLKVSSSRPRTSSSSSKGCANRYPIVSMRRFCRGRLGRFGWPHGPRHGIRVGCNSSATTCSSPNSDRLHEGRRLGVGNSIPSSQKVNQDGTLTRRRSDRWRSAARNGTRRFDVRTAVARPEDVTIGELAVGHHGAARSRLARRRAAIGFRGKYNSCCASRNTRRWCVLPPGSVRPIWSAGG